MHLVHRRAALALLAALVSAVLVTFTSVKEASALPSFARKYQTSCLTCHTVFPVLNPFGEAFRRNGYRFPSQKGSVDSDSVKASMIALGQEEYKKTFPNSVWPSNIPDAIPLSVMFNGGVNFNIPGSDAHDAAGNTFDWGDIVGELHLYGAGALSDTLTYMTQVTLGQSGDNAFSGDIETAYLLWNDIIGPDHAVNLWIGRLWNPQLTSFGLNSSYMGDTRMPGVSIVGLYNGSGGFSLGAETVHNDGVELNGILKHRFAYSVGWLASHTGGGLNSLNAEDAYVHIGVKSGGVALDGEGKYGPNVPDPAKPWAEKAITLDAFGYHGLNVLDNGTGTVAGGSATAVQQADKFDAVGGTIRAQYDSAQLDLGADYEWHSRPYAGTGATATPSGEIIPGVPDYTSAHGIVSWAELDYIIWPWLVPGVRYEYTNATAEGAKNFGLFRLVPGVAMLVRPDVRVIVTGDFESATGYPVAGSWGPAGGAIVSPTNGASTAFKAEMITATANVAF
jgi:hypothetical protein